MRRSGEETAGPVGDGSYRRRVSVALDETLRRTRDAEGTDGPPVLDPAADRYIIFSDLHRGARDGADDFRRCERAYNAALAYYFTSGHTLVELGDVEELWEERPETVIRAYGHSLGLSARFHAAGRYVRIWGNHDDAWSYPGRVRRHLQPIYPGPELEVREGLRLRVVEAGEPLGDLFLVHGHQGTTAGDRWGWLARIPVRYLWRPLQRVLKLSLNTPARDWILRERHNVALAAWTARQEGLALIAGHTHRPVFLAESHADEIAGALEAAEEALAAAPEDRSTRRRVARLRAELEWVRAQGGAPSGPEGSPVARGRRYFNSGCCAYADGDITGIEIAEGEIRLVRWPNDQDEPQPQVLERAALRDVFRGES